MNFIKEPDIRVGITSGSQIKVEYCGGNIPEFILHDVTIGIGFHWERKENQRFRGQLEIKRNNDGTLTAINIVPLEEYLRSVISSEMKSTSELELLKAHAIISRSWLMAQIYRDERYPGNHCDAMQRCGEEHRIVKWYDHEDHTEFDVCADDHCQRYQGISKVESPLVDKAVNATRGEILVYDDLICDARFSKCCGGITEDFSSCWEPSQHPYLTVISDTKSKKTDLPDLTLEKNAHKWIETYPDAFCNTTDKKLLSQVLNNYDMEDVDFYRWNVVYKKEYLDELVARKSGIDFGHITALKPLKRGASGRITLLRIEGTKRSVEVGKELEIRKWLSESHLKSSAFTVSFNNDSDWVINGAGWGHGVGLCQIGAAVMASQGYGYKQILAHYFPGAEIKKVYP